MRQLDEPHIDVLQRRHLHAKVGWRLAAREVLFPAAGPLFAGEKSALERGAKYLRTEIDPWVFDIDYARRTLCDHFKLHSLDGLGASGHNAAVRSAGVSIP